MNKTVVALSISTAIFAASTAYLAHELSQRDARAVLAGAATDTAVSPGASPHVTENGTSATAGLPTRNTVPAVGGGTEAASLAVPADAGSRDTQADPVAGFARQFLTRYDDADQRPVLLDEQRTVIRRQYEKLKDQLKLSDSTFEQLVTLLAEDQLRMQEHWARCAVKSDCDPKTQPPLNLDRAQEYQAMLGADGTEAFTQFGKSIAERDSVIQLRGRLADSNFLPEAQAEKLIAALAEERERFGQEAAARGAKTSGWGTNLGMLWFTEDSGLPEQYVVEAAQYSQRLRARASSILTPAQLATYSQMQNELLAQFTANQRPPSRQNKTVLRTS
jgi:hypothetical protein